MIPVAAALVEAGADGLCVATLDEAVALRDAGVGGRLTVLYPVPPSLARLAAERSVAVAAGDADRMRELLAAAGSGGASGVDATLDVELEVETGLGRGGAAVSEVVAVAGAISSADGARLAGVWTHLQATEDRERTTAQIARFEEALAALRSAGIDIPRRHVAARPPGRPSPATTRRAAGRRS